MKRIGTLASTLIALAAVTAGACAGGAEPGEPAPRGDAASAAELEEIYWARADSARMNYSAPEVAFMTGMIGHHAQALIMSDLAETRAASQAVRTLAARIENAQQDEIAIMQRWLRERGEPVPEVHIDGLRLMIHGAGHGEHGHAGMPGMLTPPQLEELAAAEGEAFDRLFLRYMIQHHQGAVTMVYELFGADGAGQDERAFRIASDIRIDQAQEIARMERMLSALEAEREDP